MSAGLTVVKLGGSLQQDDLLPRWLDLLVRRGGGHVVVVPGGGRFADAARAAQAQWKFGDLHAHNMAVLGMAQMAQMFHALQPGLQPASTVERMHQVLHGGGVPLWQPLDALRDASDDLTNWDTTSDSLAAWLAQRLGAQALWLVKACAVPAGADVRDLAERRIVDRALPGRIEQWGGELWVVQAGHLDQAQRLLEKACSRG